MPSRLCVLFLALGLPALPDTFGLTTSVACSPAVSGGSSASCSNTVYDTTGGYYKLNESAFASFGALQDSVSLDTYVHALQAVQHRIADSGFFDTLTIGGHAGSGFIQFHLTVDFSVASNHGSIVTVNNDSFDVPGGFPIFGSHGEMGLVSGMYAFDFGTPFLLNVDLRTILDLDIGDAGGWNSDSLILDGIHVFVQGAGLHEISDYTLTSTSGATYPIPEPAAIGLLGLAVCLLAARHTTRRAV